VLVSGLGVAGTIVGFVGFGRFAGLLVASVFVIGGTANPSLCAAAWPIPMTPRHEDNGVGSGRLVFISGLGANRRPGDSTGWGYGKRFRGAERVFFFVRWQS